MKKLIPVIFFIVALLFCSILAQPFHKKHIEKDLKAKVTKVLVESGLDPAGLEIEYHHLVKLGAIPENEFNRNALRDRLDDIIGLYIGENAFSSASLTRESGSKNIPLSFHLAEQSDESVILTGKVNEAERDYFVGLAEASLTSNGEPRRVVDELVVSGGVSLLSDRISQDKLAELAPRLLTMADSGAINWASSKLTLGGVIENADQEAEIFAAASELLPEGEEVVGDFEIQPRPDADFGVKRDGDRVVVSGLLPDVETREELLQLVKKQVLADNPNASVIDKTTLEPRADRGWWAGLPKSFVPDFLAKTEGPANVHYFSDDFIAEGSYPNPDDLTAALDKIADYPPEVFSGTGLNDSEGTAPSSGSGAEKPSTASSKAGEQLISQLKPLAVYFDSESSEIKETEESKIEEAAQLILASQDVTQGLTVGGYADTKGNAAYNKKISLARATEVRNRLIEKGVPSHRLIINHFGEDTSQVSEDDFWKSRRVEVSLTNDADLAQTPQNDPKAAAELISKLKLQAVYFDSSSSKIKKSEEPKIEEAAKLILSSQNTIQGLTVGGYADLNGNASYNKSLSLARAKAVRKLLIEKGVPASRLTVNYFGEDTSKTAQEDLWKSRRVEISLTQPSDQ